MDPYRTAPRRPRLHPARGLHPPVYECVCIGCGKTLFIARGDTAYLAAVAGDLLIHVDCPGMWPWWRRAFLFLARLFVAS